MIDFKYHLVSLISVFMALAIGVVLGAGPLQESIGNSLAEQVKALRADKDALQRTSHQQQDFLDDTDAYLAGAAPRVVAGKLAGHRVVIVRMQDSPNGAVDEVSTLVATAGAATTGTITVSTDWVAQDKAAGRAKSAAAVAAAAGDPAPADASVTGYLSSTLASVIVGRDRAALNAPRADADRILAAYTRSGLVSVAGTVNRRADVVIAISGTRVEPKTATDAEKAAQQARDDGYLGLLRALRGNARSVVLAAPTRLTDLTTLVAALRSDQEASAEICGVDDVDHPMGQISAILAAREQLDGTTSQYGTAVDALAVVPGEWTTAPATASSSPT